MRLRLSFFFVCLLGAAHLAAAEPAAAPEAKPPYRFIDTIDRYHEAVCCFVINASEGADTWLASRFRDSSQPARPERPRLVYDTAMLPYETGSQLILSPYITERKTDGIAAGLRVSGKLQLPRLSERVDLVFDSDYDEGDLTPEIRSADRTKKSSDERGIANLRLRLSDNLKVRPSLELGLKFKPDPRPRIGFRLKIVHENELFTTRFVQRVFWETHDGWGERSSFDVERMIRDEYLVRLNTSVLWSETSNGVRGGETFQFYRFLSNRRAFGTKLGMYGTLEPSVHIETYSARVSWRQRMHRDWLFIKIEPGFDWPHNRDYKITPTIEVMLDIVFGDWMD